MKLATPAIARTLLCSIIILFLAWGLWNSVWFVEFERVASGFLSFAPVGLGPNDSLADFNRVYRITHDNASPVLWAVSFLHMFATAIVGYCFWRLILDGGSLISFCRSGSFSAERKFSRVVLLAAGFSIGYPIVAAFNRIATLFIPHRDAPYILLVFWLCIGIACSIRAAMAKEARPLKLVNRSDLRIAAVLIAALLTLIVLQVQMGSAYVSGDATTRVFRNMLFYVRETEMFPIVTQHYDEPIFLYSLLNLKRWLGDYGPVETNAHYAQMLPYLIFHPVGRLSMVCLTYCLVRPYCRELPSALAVALMIFLGSHLLHPLFTRTIFDGVNPPLWALHESRVLSATLPLFLLVLSFGARASKWMEASNFGDKLGAASLLFLFGIGLSTMSLHIAVAAAAVFSAAFLSRLQDFRSPDAVIPAASAAIVAVLTTLAIGAVYLIPLLDLAGSLVLLGASAVSAIVMIMPIIGSPRAGDRQPLARSGLAALKALPQVQVIVGGMLIGYLLLGQMTGSKIAPKLFGLKSVAYSHYPEDLRYVPFVSVGAGDPRFIWLDVPDYFFLNFGLMFGLGCLGAASLWALSPKQENTASALRSLAWGLPLTMAIFPLSFFLVTFVGTEPKDAHVVWVRTRLLEAPFYTTLLLGLLACFMTARGYWTRRLLTLLTFVWALGPILVMTVSGSLIPQLRENLGAILSILI